MIEGLNKDCFCASLDAPALRRVLEPDPGDAGLHALIAERCPHIFSALPVFVSRAHVDRMAAVVRAGAAGMAVGKLQDRLDVAASTLSHHLKALVTVGLISQERQATTLICRANYDVMRGIVDFLVAECCADAACGETAKPARVA